MENPILITELNDFIFCPLSIYFHRMYSELDRIIFQDSSQINGTNAHKSIDTREYSDKKSILLGISVYSEEWNLSGKIDVFDTETGTLIERKNRITTIYDGYVFQLYGQYFALTEMGYSVNHLKFYSMSNNKTYYIPLPHEDKIMFAKFEKLVNDIRHFDFEEYIQTNKLKCEKCIYNDYCDKSLCEG
ncbi:MAG: hypothetical protein BWY15_00185 [Firmicutes bacterium ADurb.Bin193]|nr:MAG: hypothetical protein BWY15_00185 [Firmicutes bacterium ADurb.Bin193]